MEKAPIHDLMELLQEELIYKDVSMVLQQIYPGEKGFSEMSVRHFYRSKGLTTKTINDEVTSIVCYAVEQVVIYLLFLKLLITLFSLGF